VGKQIEEERLFAINLSFGLFEIKHLIDELYKTIKFTQTYIYFHSGLKLWKQTEDIVGRRFLVTSKLVSWIQFSKWQDG